MLLIKNSILYTKIVERFINNCSYILFSGRTDLITNIQLDWVKKWIAGKIKKKDNPQKYSAYMKRMRKRIDNMIKNAEILAEIAPEILRDTDWELSDPNLPLKRRARALLRIVTLFENEPTVLSLIAEIYSSHQLEITKKRD